MKINKEGYKIILVAFCIFALLSGVCFVFTPLWFSVIISVASLVTFFFVLIFFREPARPRLTDDGIIYSPADGKVVVIEEVEETEYLGERRKQVSVFMSITNVHINWYPAGGKVEYFKHHPGRFMVAWHPKSSEENERTTIVVNTGKYKILFRQVAGYVARRIVSYAEVNAEVEQNQKCGFIKFGSRVDVFLPLNAEILVNMDDKVVGSQTPIARLK